MGETHGKEVVVFKPQDGQGEFEVVLDVGEDTVWATEQQIMELFGKARRTIGDHIKNIYEEGELEKTSTWREIRQVQDEGGRKVTRKVSMYNLDVVISVGYRVKSHVGIEFRKWASQRLKDYLIQGYTINTKLLEKEREKAKELQETLDTLNQRLIEKENVITDGLLSIISHYSKSFELLNRYDKGELTESEASGEVIYTINVEDVRAAIKRLKSDLISKGEAGKYFGNEKDRSFEGDIGKCIPNHLWGTSVPKCGRTSRPVTILHHKRAFI